MKSIFKSFLSLLFLTLIMLTSTQCKKAKDGVITKFLEVEAEKTNKEYPKVLNASIRIDSCKALPGKVFENYYTLFFLNAENFDIEYFENSNKINLVSVIQKTEGLEKYRSYGVTFSYVYKDEQGNTLGKIMITEADYNRPAEEIEDELKKTLTEDNFEKNILNAMNSMKSQMPIVLSEEITLTDCYYSNKTLFYTYQLTTIDKANFDSITYKSVKYPEIKTQARNNEEMKTGLNRGFNYQYIYSDKNDKYLCTIRIEPDILD